MVLQSVSERISKNLTSASDMPEIVDAKLSKEKQANCIRGPFSSPPFSNFVCSPLRLVRKKQAGKFRLIHHLSYPHGDSVNSRIPKKITLFCQLCFCG